jgi:endogenous inhibitor of DNA gyrase (YacG/DUF329 family)
MEFICEICGKETPNATESEYYPGICTNCEKEIDEEEIVTLLALEII